MYQCVICWELKLESSRLSMHRLSPMTLNLTIKKTVEWTLPHTRKEPGSKDRHEMKLPVETWHLCFSRADWSPLAAYHHENGEAHSIHYLYWQITTLWFVGPYVYFWAERGINSITLSCCSFSLHNFITKIKFWKLFSKMELNFLWLYHGNNMLSNTFSKLCF